MPKNIFGEVLELTVTEDDSKVGYMEDGTMNAGIGRHLSADDIHDAVQAFCKDAGID